MGTSPEDEWSFFDDDPYMYNPVASNWGEAIDTFPADLEQFSPDDASTLEFEMQFQPPLPPDMASIYPDQMFDSTPSLDSYSFPTMTEPAPSFPSLLVYNDTYSTAVSFPPGLLPMMHQAVDMPGAEAPLATHLTTIFSTPGPGI